MNNPTCIKIAALLLALSFIEPRLAFADAKEDAAQAAKDIDAAYKEAQENIPNGTVKAAEDKLDKAGRDNDDTQGDPTKDPAKKAAQKKEDDARSKADGVAKAFGDKGKYREALQKRREACKRLKKALADLRQQFQKRRQSMTADTSDLHQAIKDAEKARREQEKTPERPTVGMAVPEGTPTLAALIASGKIKIDSVGTGETIGHVADLKIQNLTDQPVSCSVGPVVLESKTRNNQDYVCPKPQTAKMDPHGMATVPMNGVCVNRNKPPVGKGTPGDLIVNTGDPTVPSNPNSHIPVNQARDLLRICTSKYDAADQLQKSGALKNLPYHDPQKQKDIVVQWSTWCDPRISQITGAPPATKDDLRKVVYKQLESKKPMSPETKKKVDQGIDTIFEKVELTTAKAKELEKPDTYPQTEMPSGSFEISDQVSDETGSPAPKTQEKPKKTKKEKKEKGPPGEWSKPILDWWWKLVDADRADLKKRIAEDDYEKQRNDFFKKSKYHEELIKKINEKQGALEYWGPKDTEKLIKERDELKKELGKLEGELEKDFQKTDEGKKALTAKGNAQKAAADAAKAEQEAGKYLDKEAIEEKAFEELKKWAWEKALKEVREGSGMVHE